MFAIGRVRTLARAMRGAVPKRTRLSDELNLEFREAEGAELGKPADSDTVKHALRVFFFQLETFILTAAVAGHIEVGTTPDTTYYFGWCDGVKCQRELELRVWPLLGKFREWSVTTYVTEVEEAFRAKAIEMARSSDTTPFGSALLKAQEKHHHIWEDKKGALGVPRGVPRPEGFPDPPNRGRGRGYEGSWDKQRERDAPPGPPNKGGGKGSKGNKGGGGDGLATASETHDGWKICKKHNDKRGCKSKHCPDGGAHVCDVMLENGGACGSKLRKRRGHTPKRDGYPASR